VRNHEPVLALPRTHGLGVVEQVTSEAFASWCATMSKLGRLRPPKMAACHPSWRTNWRALGILSWRQQVEKARTGE
jgi:hypothetical protein